MGKAQDYECAVPFDACRYFTVSAKSPEEAAEVALEKAGTVSLCHQCTDEIEVGESVGVYVRWGDNCELDTTFSGERIRELEAKVTAQAAATAEARALVGQMLEAHHGFQAAQIAFLTAVRAKEPDDVVERLERAHQAAAAELDRAAGNLGAWLGEAHKGDGHHG